MIHVKYTSIANRTMMASFRFENVTHKAITTTFLFRITKMEAPKNWNLSRIGCHCLYEGPNKHNENQIENHKHYHYQY